MTLRTRKGIFYLFTLLFVVVGAYLVLLTQGIAIDWAKLKLVRSGAIYLHTVPPDASILINKVPHRSADSILSRGTLVKNLLPRTYRVEVMNDGYYPWEKDLAVEEGLVASASNIVLWPKKMPEQTIASSSVKNFWIAEGGAITQTDEGALRFGAHALKGARIVEADPNTDEVVTKDLKGTYFAANLADLRGAVNISALFASLEARAVSSTKPAAIIALAAHPFSPEKLFVATNRALYMLDLKRETLQWMIALPSLARITVTDNEVFASDNAGNFSGINLLLNTASRFSIATTTVAEVNTNPSGTKFFVLDKQGKLFEYDRAAATSTRIAENINSFFLSPDEKRLALVHKDRTVGVLYLENVAGDTQIAAGTEVPIAVPNTLPSSEIAPMWIPDIPNYLLVKNNADVFAAEIDPRTPANISLLFSHIKKTALADSTLYLLRNNGVLSSVALP